MKKTTPIIVVLCIVLAALFWYFGSIKTSMDTTHLVGKACDNVSGNDIPEGYQCYFFGPNEMREGVLIKPDIAWPTSFSGDLFSPHRKIAASWKTFSDPLHRFSFRLPQDFRVSQNDTKDTTSISALDGDPVPQINILYYETNGVPMESNFPKGCLPTEENFGGKDTKRFDCAAITNIGTSIKNVQLFIPVEGGYYQIVGNYSGRNSYDDFVTDALLATFMFGK